MRELLVENMKKLRDLKNVDVQSSAIAKLMVDTEHEDLWLIVVEKSKVVVIADNKREIRIIKSKDDLIEAIEWAGRYPFEGNLYTMLLHTNLCSEYDLGEAQEIMEKVQEITDNFQDQSEDFNLIMIDKIM